MDPRSFNKGPGYYTVVPGYTSQPSLIPQPVYPSYQQATYQTPGFYPPSPVPTPGSYYQQPPPVHPIPVTTVGSLAGLPLYSHVQNIPPPSQAVQGQAFHFPPPPHQQYNTPTHHSNMYAANPPAPPVKAAVTPVSSYSWSAAITPPSPLGYNFSSRSPTPPSSNTLTFIPPRLKLLAEQYHYATSAPTDIPGNGSNTLLHAASQHGITRENSQQNIPAAPAIVMHSTKHVEDMLSEPVEFMPSANTGFDLLTDSKDTVIERQTLVDYYVNKLESFEYKKLIEEKSPIDGMEWKVDDEICDISNYSNNNNIDVTIAASQHTHSDKNSNVLNWLSDINGIPIAMSENESINAEFDRNSNVGGESGVNFDLNEDPFLTVVESAETDVKNTTHNCISEDTNFFFDESDDIVIEEHEFLSCNVETSLFGEESSSTSYDKDSADDFDVFDGGMKDNSADFVGRVRDLPSEVKRASQTDTELDANVQEGFKQKIDELVASIDTIPASTHLVAQTDDEKIVTKYKQQLKETQNAQAQLLTAASGEDVDTIACNTVKQAIAKGVLKYFNSFSDRFTGGAGSKCCETEYEESDKYENESELDSKKGLYSWMAVGNSGEEGAVSNELLTEGNLVNKPETDGAVESVKTEIVQDVKEMAIKPSTNKVDDFEKFFFKQTASKHGITIVSPEKPAQMQSEQKTNKADSATVAHDEHDTKLRHCVDPYEHVYRTSETSIPISLSYQNSQESESDCVFKNQKYVLRSGIKNKIRRFSGEVDSDVNSLESSQSEAIDAFMKTSQKGIRILDQRNIAEFSTDSDIELEQFASKRSSISRCESADLEDRRMSTTNPMMTNLNPESLEFKPGWKKRSISSGLRPDAVEFNPESLHSSQSLNTSITGSDMSEKLDSSMRVDAPEFVPVLSKSCSNLRSDAIAFEPEEIKPAKPKIFYIPTPKEEQPNPSVAIQASPDTSSACVGTRRIKTKEAWTVTGSCSSRDVSINTDNSVNTETAGDTVTVKRSTFKYSNKATNTDMSQKRSVGINVRSRKPLKEPTIDKMTMTDVVQVETEECKETITKSDQSDALETKTMAKSYKSDHIKTKEPMTRLDHCMAEKLEKQAVLLEDMRTLQIELMGYKEKEMIEKLTSMKQSLVTHMTSVMELYVDGVEADVLQSMIQSKLMMLEESLSQVKSVTYSTISRIRSGWVLAELPDFSNILPQMSKSPTRRFISPQRQSSSLGTSPQRQSTHNIPGTSPQRQSMRNIPGSSPQQQSMHNIHGTSLQQQSMRNIPGSSPPLQSTICELGTNLQSAKIHPGTSQQRHLELNKPETTPVLMSGTSLESNQECCTRVQGIRSRVLDMSQDEYPNWRLPITRSQALQTSSPKRNLASVKLSYSPEVKLSLTDTDGEIKFPHINIGSLSLNVSTDFSSQLEDHVTKLKSPNHVIATPVKKGDHVTREKSLSLMISKSCSPRKMDGGMAGCDTIANSVKELDHLRIGEAVLDPEPSPMQNKLQRTRGLMEIEDSSDDEEGNDDDDDNDTALVIDKLDNNPEDSVELVTVETSKSEKDIEFETVENREETSIDNKNREETSIENKNREETGVDNKNREETSIENTNREETGVDNKNREETSIDNKNREETNIDNKNREETSIENKNREETGVDNKNREETSIDNKNSEETSICNRNREETSIENKNREETCIDNKNKAETSIGNRNREEASIENKSREETSIDNKNREDKSEGNNNREETSIDNKNKEETGIGNTNKRSNGSKNREEICICDNNGEEMSIDNKNREETSIYNGNKEETSIDNKNREETSIDNKNREETSTDNKNREETSIGSKEIGVGLETNEEFRNDIEFSCTVDKESVATNGSVVECDEEKGFNEDYLNITDKAVSDREKIPFGTQRLDESGDDINYETAEDESTEDIYADTEGRQDDPGVSDKCGAIEKLISEKMYAEYGEENVYKCVDLSSVKMVDCTNTDTGFKCETILDAIDSDENESTAVESNTCIDANLYNTAVQNEETCVPSVGDIAIENREKFDFIEDVNEEVRNGFKDHLKNEETGVASKYVTSSVPSGILAGDIDPKELFMSPPRKPISRIWNRNEENLNVASVGAVEDVNPAQMAVAHPSMMGSMPMMLGNMDPALYQAVLTQLIQAYPELASNNEMLTQVAIQQTGLLHMYMNSQTGDVGQAGGTMESASAQGVIGSGMQGLMGNTDVGMMGFGQQLPVVNTGVNSDLNTISTTISTVTNSDLQRTVSTSKSLHPPGFLQNSLQSKNESEPVLREKDTQLNRIPTSVTPPGFCSLTNLSINNTDCAEMELPRKRHKHSNISQEGKVKINCQFEKREEEAGRSQTVKQQSVSGSDMKSAHSSSTVLDNFDVPIQFVGAQPQPNINNNASCSENMKNNTKSNAQPDFLPEFAKRHPPENTSVRVVHHFVKNYSDTVTRAIANSNQINFERKTPSPPFLVAEPGGYKKERTDFPPLEKIRSSSKTDTANSFTTIDSNRRTEPTKSQTTLYTVPTSRTEQYTRPPNQTRSLNVHPSLLGQSSQENQPHRRPAPKFPPATPDYPPHRSATPESWDNELDNNAQTFTLHHDTLRPISMAIHHDIHRPVTMALHDSVSKPVGMATRKGTRPVGMATEKNQHSNMTNRFVVPAPKNASTVQCSSRTTKLCDNPLPNVAKDTEEDVEQWCEVQTKRRRHSSKEQQKELRKYSAPYVNSAPMTSSKPTKANNFERLIGRIQQEFPEFERQAVITAIHKIREVRGSLSGLSIEAIIEKSCTYLQIKPKQIPKVWASQNQHSQTSKKTPRMQPAGPKSLLDLKLPPRKQFQNVPSVACTNTFDEDICVICHDALTTEPVKELDCMHVFHTRCITQWVERERTCPTCRQMALFPEEFPRLGK